MSCSYSYPLDYSKFEDTVRIRPTDTAQALIVNGVEIAFATYTVFNFNTMKERPKDKAVLIMCKKTKLSPLEEEALQAFKAIVDGWNAK